MTYADTGYYGLAARHIRGAEKFDSIMIDDRDRRVRGPGHWLMYFSRKNDAGRWEVILTVGRRLFKGCSVLGRVVGGGHDLSGDVR